jgi:hypothetical protein
MKYDTSDTIDKNKAKIKFNKLVEEGKKIELKELKPPRSLNQNKYLHVCISLFAINFGWTLSEAKTHLKRACNFMVYEKNGEKFLKLTRTMDSKELTEFIDWLRTYSAQNGCYIPTAEEYHLNRFEIDKEIDQNKPYL